VEGEDKLLKRELAIPLFGCSKGDKPIHPMGSLWRGPDGKKKGETINSGGMS